MYIILSPVYERVAQDGLNPESRRLLFWNLYRKLRPGESVSRIN
jgi:hypothetical protein